MKRPQFIRGIRDKLIVAFSALVAIIALFVFAFFPARLEEQAMTATRAKATAIREMAAYSLAAGLLFDDSVAVREVLAGAARVNDVAFLEVRNSAGALVATRGDAPPRTLPLASTGGVVTPDGRTLVATVDIMSSGAQIGTLAVGISLASLRAEVAHARRVGALVSALIFVVGILAIFVISTFVTRPLTAVAETVNRIASGDLTSRAAEPPDVEMRHLVRAFNHMIDTLVGTQAELAAMNEALEGRVESRTAQLQLAMEDQTRSQVALALSETTARRTSELLQSLIDLAPQAIVSVDEARRVTRWNLAAEELFGWSAAEVLGKPVPFLVGENEESFSPRLLAASANRRTTSEVIRPRKDGSFVSVLLAAGILHDHDQRVAGVIGIFTDLTERNRLEETLRQSQKMDAMGRFAGGIAHDFNNILTIITACTELLLTAPRNDEEREELDQIAGACARAAALTRQLLTFTRQQIIQLQPVDVEQVVRSLEPMLRRVLPSHIRLITVLSGGTGVILADPSQLEQVVMNLVVNASDAMPDGGLLHVELHTVALGSEFASEIGLAGGTYNHLVVRDTGVGINETALARIFEPFFTTKDVGKGTGLGLATAYGIVTALGGAIRVRSTVGQGTTFQLYLPQIAIETTEATEAIGVQEPMSATAPSRSTILVVEDEAAVRQVVRRTLERSGYRVLEAADGEQGMAMVAQHGDTLNAVVTDMMMPGMSGRVFAERLAALHPDLGVVCISGYVQSGIGDGPMLDANHIFLQKPFTRHQLIAAIESVETAGNNWAV